MSVGTGEAAPRTIQPVVSREGIGVIAQKGGVDSAELRHRATPKEKPEEPTESLKKRKESETNKYKDGVDQVAGYFTDGKMTPNQVSSVLNYPRNPGESDEAYMQRAAEHVFQEVRVRRFGKAAVLPEGGAVTSDTLGQTTVFGREAWSPSQAMLNHFRLQKQIAETRGEVRDWRTDMKDRREAWLDAHAAVVYYPNQGEAGRVEAYADARAIAAVAAQGAEAVQKYLQNVPEGEAIQPLQTLLGRIVRMEGGKIPSQDIREATTEEDTKKLGQRVQEKVGQVLQSLKLPADVLPFITGGDTRISQIVEAVAGFASKSPEAVFKAHEALLDLKAYSDAVMKITGGKVNIMLHLNEAVGDMTKAEGQERGMLSVTDLIDYTEAGAEDFIMRHPEQGLTRLLNDANRERIKMGGDTALQRRGYSAAFAIARMGIPELRDIDDREAVDPYVQREQELQQTMTNEEYIPKWWHIGKKAKEARAEHRNKVKAAKKGPEKLGPSGATVKAQEAERTKGFESMTTEELEAYLAEQDRLREAGEQQSTEAAAGRETQAREQALRKEEDQRLKDSQDEIDRLDRLYKAQLVAKARNLRTVDQNVLTETRRQLAEARSARESLTDTVDRRRFPDFYANREVIMNPDSDAAQKSAAYQAIRRDYPTRVAEVDALMVNAPEEGELSESVRDLVDRYGYNIGRIMSDAIASARAGIPSEDDLAGIEEQIRRDSGNDEALRDRALSELRAAVQQVRVATPQASTFAGAGSPLNASAGEPVLGTTPTPPANPTGNQ